MAGAQWWADRQRHEIEGQAARKRARLDGAIGRVVAASNSHSSQKPLHEALEHLARVLREDYGYDE